MNHQDRVPDPRTYGAPSGRPRRRDASSDSLGAFVSESSVAGTPFTPDAPVDVLCEFPEEAAIANGAPRARVSIGLSAVRAMIAATMVIGAFAVWAITGRTFLPVERQATEARRAFSANEAVAPTTQTGLVIASQELPPLRAEPVASITPSAYEDSAVSPKPVALSTASPQRPTVSAPMASIARGTSGRSGEPLAGVMTRPPAEPIDLSPSAAEPTPIVKPPVPASVPAVEPTIAAVKPSPRVPEPVERPAPEAVATVAARTEQAGIQQALTQYRSAYQRLDADAAQAVWPSVDARALARAFDSLSSQELAFDACQLDIAGEIATAQCRGNATYTPKIGSKGPRLEARQWVFHLRKAGDGWKIQNAQTKR